MFTLEPGDTGEAILVPHSDRDGSESPADKVNDRQAYDTAPERIVRNALAWISGYNPELYQRALRRAHGDWT